MKLLVFAHTPPPHHGQSYMVELMLAGLGGDCRRGPRPGEASAEPQGAGLGIECYHVNARLSKKLEDIGDFRVGKLLRLLSYCAQAIWCRFRYGVTTLYYIPAPGKRSALYRDWVVMLLCRPFFKRVILHWHAAGLGKWLETAMQMRTRAFTYRLLKQVDLSIVLSHYNRADAEKFFSRHIQVVGNGIPDPCPEFGREVLSRRKARLAARRKLLAGEPLSAADLENTGGDPHLFKVVYVAHCTRQKGLFDSLEAVALANARLAKANSPVRLHLSVAGEFVSAAERREFEERVSRPDLQLPASISPKPASSVTRKGFVFGDEKEQLLAESDCFCFPTYYYAESLPLVVLEAMAFGLPIVATRWRSIPELLPREYPGLVDIRKPEQTAQALLDMVLRDVGEELRGIYLRRFSLEQHLKTLAAAIHSVELQSANQPASLVPSRR